uniref:YSIRK-type signal peptide-containing protein n=1 Tax=Rhizobium brockwellii TaxID=3019932 RepID=UPI003873C77B
MILAVGVCSVLIGTIAFVGTPYFASNARTLRAPSIPWVFPTCSITLIDAATSGGRSICVLLLLSVSLSTGNSGASVSARPKMKSPCF